jgi:diaminopimelate decarboxylase
LRIFISGVHSGPNPSPGVGIARSLREAYPDAHLVAVDYASRSSGLLWPDFNSCLVRPPWQSIDLKAHAAFVAARLAEGSLWISGLDPELRLLSRHLRHRRPSPFPSAAALKMAVKPALGVASRLGLPVPPFQPLTACSEQDFGRFCRLHGWPLWIKGIHYDAVPVWSWYDLGPVIAQLAAVWGGRDQLFAQAHVEGQDVTVAFAAWQGELLGAAFLEKLDRTLEGKVWSGRISPISDELRRRLRRFLRATRWSGGGEIECVRDAGGRLWLLECNPRFPAWIYAAATAGYNLPARLVEAMTGRPGRTNRKPDKTTFTRVVTEVPALA